MKKILALCEGRHEMPSQVEGAIFGNELDPLNTSAMEETAAAVLQSVTELELYVTGLTVALVAVVNVCHVNNIKLTLMHFDRSSGTYYPQIVK